jgi:hypothetical protein
MSFHNARLKIKRADKHIYDAQAAVIALKRAYASFVEVDAQTGGRSIKYECPGFDERKTEIALIVGDAIHNLRTALDYAWMATIDRLSLPPTKYTKFPFVDDAKTLENALKERGIETASPLLFKAVMTEIQPYPAGNLSLYSLHDIDITDKHKLLVPLMDYTGASHVSVKDEYGTVRTGDTLSFLGSNGIFYVDFAPNVEIKNEGEVSVSIFFHEGTPLAGFKIPAELFALSCTALSVVERLERLVL